MARGTRLIAGSKFRGCVDGLCGACSWRCAPEVGSISGPLMPTRPRRSATLHAFTFKCRHRAG
eukprot:scaffold315342_cov27-Tisochrysis_lutea.AAC.2